MLEARVVLRIQALELRRVARGEREELLHVEAEEAFRGEEAELPGDQGAVVGTVHAVAVIPEAAHQGVVGRGDARGRPSALDDRLRPAESGRVRDHEGEVRRECVDEVQVVGGGPGVRVREQQRGCVGPSRGHVEEVDGLAVDLGEEVRPRVQLLLDRAPVEAVAPAVDGGAQIAVGGSGAPVVGGGGLREAGACEALPQIGELGLVDADRERADGEGGVGFHRSHAMVDTGSMTS